MFLLESLVEARVDALSSFRRIPMREEREAGVAALTPVGKPGGSGNEPRKIIERNVGEATFVSTSGAARQFLNQIVGASDQFFIIRLLRVRNQNDKGPSRELDRDGANDVTTGRSHASTGPGEKAKPNGAVNFIVGNEHIEVCATIEMVRFAF